MAPAGTRRGAGGCSSGECPDSGTGERPGSGSGRLTHATATLDRTPRRIINRIRSVPALGSVGTSVRTWFAGGAAAGDKM